ncbi:MAG: PepSY domain-containing protein [Acidobacteriota bacterium]|nr:PepSY domain-containing protein [Acidobacteriota bacterium]
MSTSPAFLKAVRLTHLYLGVFLAPSILFFAFTGALQTAGLHESIRGTNYKPAAWIVTLAQLHKKQTTEVPTHKFGPGGPPAPQPATAKAEPAPAAGTPAALPAAPAGEARESHGHDGPSGPKHSTVPMKAFFLLVSLGLALSTVLGVYMSYKFNRNKTLVTWLLIAGVVVPLLLLLV